MLLGAATAGRAFLTVVSIPAFFSLSLTCSTTSVPAATPLTIASLPLATFAISLELALGSGCNTTTGAGATAAAALG